MPKTNEPFFTERQHVVLTTGLGLSDRGVPLRLPALLIPGLTRLRQTFRQGRTAEYIVYQATGFIVETNKLEAEKACAASALCERYLKGFTQRFFPDLAPHVRVLTGKACVIDEADLREIEKRLKSVNGKPEDAEAKQALDLIGEYGKNHKGGDKHFRYAAANILLNAGYAENYPLLTFKEPDRTLVEPLGGEKERPFFSLTAYMAKATGCAHEVKPIIVPVGKMPTYYPCPDGDLLVGESAAGFRPSRRIKGDFAALEEVGASIPALQALALPSSPPRTPVPFPSRYQEASL